MSIDVWNYINKQSNGAKIHEKSRSICKKYVTKFLIDIYGGTGGVCDVEVRF